MKRKNFQSGLVYSTNSDLIQEIQNQEIENSVKTLSPEKQRLKVYLDIKTKPGKKITIVDNFVGTIDDLEVLAKKLKMQFGVGGSIQQNQIWLQGDIVFKVTEWLKSQEYNVKNK